VLDSGFRDVVDDLRLWNVDDGSTHASDEDDTAWSLLPNHMPSRLPRAEEGTIKVDSIQLSHLFRWVVQSWVIVHYSRRVDHDVDMAKPIYHSLHGILDTIFV